MRVLHVPRAHTDGDSIIHFVKSDVIHMGDVYFNGLYPFIDTSSGGSADGVIAACDQVLAIASDKTRIIPGHGPLSDKVGLKAYRDMLATVTARIRRMLGEGRSLEDITASKASAEFDEKWGNGFIPPAKLVEAIARGIRENR